MNQRRALLRCLAASPLMTSGLLRKTAANAAVDDDIGLDTAVTCASDALDIFDLERVASQKIPPSHWGYLSTGVDGNETLLANREAYLHWQLRTRRLVDLSHIDMSVELFGTRYASPIYLSALGGQSAFHGDGELGTARATKTHNQLLMLSTFTSCAVEDVIASRGAPVWFQLYSSNSVDVAVQLVRRAKASGCKVLAVTVDVPLGRNTPTFQRWKHIDHRSCTACHAAHGPELTDFPMFAGMDTTGVSQAAPQLTWDVVRRIRDSTKMITIVKGIESAEDATLAVKHGFDGIVVSNHGGRATETARGTLANLPEVVTAVNGKIPVFLDGGVRRGTDALKALALGATAVGIGRPYVWGLGAFGEAGVERALTILNEELRLAMVGVGARSIKEITAATLIRKS